MTSDKLMWLKQLGAKLRAYLGAEPVLPEEIKRPLARLDNQPVTKFVSNTPTEKDPPEGPREV